MTTNNITIMNKTNEQSDKEFLEEVLSDIIEEAIHHFNSIRKRQRADDERYFFNKKDVETVISRLNNPDNVECTEDLNPDGSVFCYILNFKSFVAETRNRGARASA